MKNSTKQMALSSDPNEGMSNEQQKRVDPGNGTPLSPEKLRQTPGLENLSDQEAAKAIESINALVAILYEVSCQNKTLSIDNQSVVYLNQQKRAA